MARASDRNANWDLNQRFSQVYEQYSKMRSGMAGLQQKLSAFEAEESSSDGLVKVTVDARGRLINVDLQPSCFRQYSAAELGDVITKTVARAAAAASQAVTEIMSEFMPEESGALKFMRSGDLGAMMGRPDDTVNYRPEA